MKKSIGIVLCLLSAKLTLASEVADVIGNNIEITADNFNTEAMRLYDEGSKGALMLALKEIQQKAIDRSLNPVNGKRPPLELAYILNEEDEETVEKSLDLYGFFLRLGANPELTTLKGGVMREVHGSDDRYLSLMNLNRKIHEIEPFIIRAMYASSNEDLATIVAELKGSAKLDVVAEEEDISNENMGPNEITTVIEGESTSGNNELENETKEIVIEQADVLSDADKVEVLEWLKDEKLKEAQKISDLASDFKGEKRQIVVSPGYGLLHLAGVATGVGLVSAGATYLLMKNATSGN